MRLKAFVLVVALAAATAAFAQDARAALAQAGDPRVDSLLRVADSVRSPGQGRGPDSALVRLRLAVALEPSARVHAAIADAFVGIYSARRTERAAYDSALAHADEALRADPGNTRARFNKGLAHALAGERSAALAEYERVLALDSTHARVAPLLITEYYDAGRTREALALGERTQALQPRNHQAQFRLGWAYGYLWEQEKAAEIFRRLASDSTSGIYRAWGHGELAYLSRARGDFADAVRHMEQAVRAVPSDRISQLGLATMLLTAGDAARARPLIERALAGDSNATGYGAIPGRLLLGWAARDLGDSALAHDMLREVERRILTSVVPGNDQRPMLLKVYALQGRRADAVALLEQLSGLSLDNLYGGPDDHDGTLASLRDVPEFQAFRSKLRERVMARRGAMDLPSLPES